MPDGEESNDSTNVLKHPVHQLERYLETLAETTIDPLSTTTTIHTNGPNHHPTDRQDEMIRVAEFLFGTTLLTAALTLLDSHESIFTKVSSVHRSLWLVRGSGDASYMCFVSSKETPNLYYCNCRSFLEKTTKKAESVVPELCKHLLALKLIPVLDLSCPHLTLSDKEFAKLVLERTFKSSSH